MRTTGSWKLTATLALSLIALSACERYSADPIEAWVVDASTKAPLEGVVVTANWQLTGGFEGGYPKGQMMVMETVTDKAGRFYFPAWGPKVHLGEGRLRQTQPQLLLFKSGYQHRRLYNEVTSDEIYTGKSEWSAKLIELKALSTADVQSRYDNLLSFSKEVDNFATWYLDPCEWTKLPVTVKTIKANRKKLEASGGRSRGVRTLDVRLLEGEQELIKTCGSAGADFLRETKRD